MANDEEGIVATAVVAFKQRFLDACVQASALKFGTFTLKSGRQSPYFFNAGILHTATLLEVTADAYAETILRYAQQNPGSPFAKFDVVFGPAYKGIPLAVATTMALKKHNPDSFAETSYSFNRKEAKDHGEGGNIVGADMSQRKVIIVDDVVTAGTALKQAAELLTRQGAELVGIVVALDRQEKMSSTVDSPKNVTDNHDSVESTLGELRRALQVPILSVLTLDDLIVFSKAERSQNDLDSLEAYRIAYGARH